ncbi:hypothetical protein FHX09_001299 [Rhizobium sp. BK538]|nr:hypothetical protein [Rhizobium sp. BK060]MBB4167468.1 hypothetical protein [Rhizobium sp. BK538]
MPEFHCVTTGAQRRVRARDRGNEAVATAGDRGDVTRSILPVAEGFAQPGHVEAQIALFNDNIRPNPGHQIGFAQEGVGSGYKRDQEVQSPRAKLDWNPFLSEKPPAHIQTEGAEGQVTCCIPISPQHGISP